MWGESLPLGPEETHYGWVESTGGIFLVGGMSKVSTDRRGPICKKSMKLK